MSVFEMSITGSSAGFNKVYIIPFGKNVLKLSSCLK